MWEDGQTEEGEKEKSGGLSQQRLLQSAAPPSTSVDRLNAPISTNPTLSDTFSFSAWMGLNHSEKIEEDFRRTNRAAAEERERGERRGVEEQPVEVRLLLSLKCYAAF